ncbi:GIY-YIG nuclease family protein [Variovorax sp. W2I14]|uniref:GIY-YIG nuclease family protein n=1 Tax=Variovorax sp. W2I14 TaxID=3042290 RepID=UPI003D1DAD41
MLLFDLLRLQEPLLEPTQCKVHLAGWTGIENPLRVYSEGNFDAWQAGQTRKNFERQYVVSLIQMADKRRWLYVGVYESLGSKPNAKGGVTYKLRFLPSSEDLAGRVVATFERPSRQSYLRGESVAPSCEVYQLNPEKLHLAEFPGFKKVNVSFGDLGVIVRQAIPSWRAALENVAGVYLISDHLEGKLYVGSATGAGGIWARWCEYLNGHGENVRLRKLIKEGGAARAEHFHFSVLEIADTHTSGADVLLREGHWKEVLLTRLHGHNGN